MLNLAALFKSGEHLPALEPLIIAGRAGNIASMSRLNRYIPLSAILLRMPPLSHVEPHGIEHDVVHGSVGMPARLLELGAKDRRAEP